MKFKFWKKSKETEGKHQGPKFGVNVVVIPDRMFKVGMILQVEEDHRLSVIEPEGAVLERLGVKMEIGYDPNFRGNCDWRVAFMPSYSWRGRTFGADGPKVVKEVGLDFPRDRMELADDGRITLFYQGRPPTQEIERAVQEAQRQVADIMRRYGETKEILDYLDKGKNEKA